MFLDAGSLGQPDELDLSALTQALPELELYAATAPEDVVARITGAAVVLVNKVRLDARTLDAGAGALRLICLAATGTDNVDLEAARRHGIAVCNIRDYCSESVAEHVLALLLALTRQLVPYHALLRDGAWSRSPHFCMLDFPVRQLAGRTFGVVGLGTLGRAVAGAAAGLGMTVVAARRPYRLDAPAQGDASEAGGILRRDFAAVIETADVLSLHCPLTDGTRGLIGRDVLARMRPDAVLLNTARGALVDTGAVVEALRAGRLGGAGLDVLPVEPPPPDDPALVDPPPNLLVTPHIAWAAREARQRAVAEMGANVRAFLAGAPRNRVA